MNFIYRCLLFLYPADYRSEYADEMASVFAEVHAETREAGWLRRGAFHAREFSGLLEGALLEQVRALTGFDRWAPPSLFASRRFMMRSEFRFPKSTLVLMVVILAGVILTIEKSFSIQASLPDTSPHLPPIQPHFTLLSGLLEMFLAVYAAAALGWIILFVLRRSGVHRLSETPAAPERK